MSKKKVVILSRSFGKASDAPLKLLEKHGIEYELKRNDEPGNIDGIIEKIGAAEAVILGNDTLNKKVMDQCEKLKFVSKQGVGLDSIDLDYAAERGVTVRCTPNANGEAVADLALALMLSVQRDLPQNLITSDTPDWASKQMSHDLFGKCVGLVGYGRIGQVVARRLLGFNVHILVYETNLSKDCLQDPNIQFVSLDELCAQADIISLHVPLLDSTRNMVDAMWISKMKNDSVLINVSRGGLVDEKALYEGLKSGKLRGAGLDVFAVEPPVKDELLTLKNVIATPHIAPHTVETNLRMGMHAAQNIVDYFAAKEE